MNSGVRKRHLHFIITALLLLIANNNAFSKKQPSRVDFSNWSFHTPANFSNKRFDDWTYFSATHFGPWANFSSALFSGPAIFTSSHFDSVADFSYSHFKSWGYFYEARFDSRANFSNAHFDSLAYFSHAHFYLTADFFRTIFESWADYSSARFDILADFSDAHFKSPAYFYGAHFNIMADFSNASFDTLANFRYASFDSIVDFSRAHFSSLVDYRNSRFKQKIILRNLSITPKVRFDFNHSVLPDTVDLSNNPGLSLDMPSTIDFTLADSLDNKNRKISKGFWNGLKFFVNIYFCPSDTMYEIKGKHLVNLYNTDITNIKIDYTHFRLYFIDVETNDTLHRVLSDDVKGSIYEQLLKNFKDRGQMDSYELLDIEYKWYKGREYPFLTGVIDWWWRFGFEKWRIFIHSFIIIILFSMVNFFLMPKLNDRNNGVYHIDLVPDFLPFKFSKNTPYRIVRRFWFSIVYTSMVFFLLTFKIEKIKYSKPISLWLMFIYTVGLICMGFIANLIIQK